MIQSDYLFHSLSAEAISVLIRTLNKKAYKGFVPLENMLYPTQGLTETLALISAACTTRSKVSLIYLYHMEQCESDLPVPRGAVWVWFTCTTWSSVSLIYLYHVEQCEFDLPVPQGARWVWFTCTTRSKVSLIFLHHTQHRGRRMWFTCTTGKSYCDGEWWV